MSANYSELEFSRAAPYDIWTWHKEALSEAFYYAFADLGSSNLVAVVSETPTSSTLLSLVASAAVEYKTYQQWVDEGIIKLDDVPDGESLLQPIPISTITLSASQVSINALPLAETHGANVELHWSLIETTPNLDGLAAGRFIIQETA